MSGAPVPTRRRGTTASVARTLVALVVVGGLLAALAHSRLPRMPAHPGARHTEAVEAMNSFSAGRAGQHSNALAAAGGGDGSTADGGVCADGGGGTWCDNFVGSPTLAVDDRGTICHVSAVRDSGCCPPPPPGGAPRARHRFGAADRCRFFDVTAWDVATPNDTSAGGGMPREYADVAEELELHDGAYCGAERRCCSLHELCVSCCMAGGDSFPAASSTGAPTADPGRFRACVSRCRHSSANTYHQNQYESPLHHCYGPDPAAAGGGSADHIVGRKANARPRQGRR